MARSQYPSKLDTSKEIPAVRDNILEVGSESINSLRSAIFNIERALGINPQGTSGNTVANRLNAALDGNGKIRKEALALAGVLSGPIVDADVSSVAAISEKKIRLDFPTKVLQDQISIVGSDLDTLKQQIDALAASLSAHTNSSAVNRHKAAAIYVKPTTSTGSDEGLTDLEATSVQQALEDLHDRHINYTGEEISESNNSHLANQIYFDDANVSGVLDADDVQEAIEKAALLTNIEAIKHQDRQHANGYLRSGIHTDPTNSDIGLILAEDILVGFNSSAGESDGLTKITFDEVIDFGGFTLSVGDFIIIEDEADADGDYVGTYEIAKINLDGDDNLTNVEVYGFLKGSDTATTLATVAKNPRRTQNVAGLLLSTREKATLTSADSIQVANPNAATLLSKGVIPSEITSTNRYISLDIDGNGGTQYDLYDGGSAYQSVDSIVKRFNEQAVENNHSVLAYRVPLEDGGVEWAIVHNYPADSDKTYSLSVSQSSDGGLTTAGLEHLKDNTFYGEDGAIYFVQGIPMSGLGEKMDTTGLSFFAGGTTITIGTSGVNFIDSNIKIGDLLLISGASDTADDGSFVITEVTSETLTLATDQLPSGFTGEAAEDTRFVVYDSVFNFQDAVFDKVGSGFGASIFECFINSKQELHWNKRIEYQAEISGVDSLFYIVDYDGQISDGDTFTLDFEVVNSKPYVSLDSGDKKLLTGENLYVWVISGTTHARLKLYIPSSSSIDSYVTANGTVSTAVYGFDPINERTGLILGKVPFGNFNGRVAGGIDSVNPRVFGSPSRGNLAWKDVQAHARDKMVYEPIRELRDGGVIYGVKVTSSTIADGLYSIVVDPGICYVRGHRFEIDAATIETDIISTSVDKFYVAVNPEGEIVFAPADTPSCDNPFAGSDCITIAVIEYDDVTVRVIDLRLFVSSLDLKVLNAITVSPDSRMGHFSSVPDALKYAKRFANSYPEAGTPTIHLKSGTHEVIVEKDESSKSYATWLTEFGSSPATVLNSFYTTVYDEGIFIDFPVTLEGEGDGTTLSVRSRYTFSDQTIDFRGVIFIPGDGFSTISAPNDTFSSGFIKISDMKIDNARVSMVDLNVEDDTETFVFGIDLENLVFDLDNFTSNTFDDAIGNIAIQLTEDDDTDTNKGNVRIDNCKFIKSYFDVSNVSRIRNLRFTNNSLYSDSSGYLIRDDLLTFSSAADGSNIEIYGNYIANNENTMASSSAPLLTTSQKMGTRMESDLYLGGSANIEGSATADAYSYNGTHSAYRHIYIDDFRWAYPYTTNPGTTPYLNMDFSTSGMSMSSYNNGTRSMYVMYSEDNDTDYITLRLPDIRAGQTLTAMYVWYYVASPYNVFAPYEFTVYSEDVDMVRTTYGPYDGSATPRTSNFGFSAASMEIEGGGFEHFYVKINRRAPGGALTQFITHITYVVETSTVEGIGGF
jgi:hypothetical protein